MAILKCKQCGGDLTVTDGITVVECEYCGIKQTLPTVDDEQKATQFNRGNHFRRNGEFDKALSIYENIVRDDDTDAEAHWCCTLCRYGIEYVKDPASGENVPTCHRASFDSILEDVDYKEALKHSDGITRRQYEEDAAKIAEVQKGILATSQNEDPFDVFICYKESDESGNRTVDSTLAQDIYYQLTEAGLRVFFSRITLEDKVGKEYEPYIFAALHSAKVMLVIGTKAEYLNAVWVKNEWSRYLAIMRNDRKKLLIPCYRNMDPYDLPDQLSVLQSYDMSKIGFIQDLLRGVKKVIDADKVKEPVKETVVVNQSADNSNTLALLKRGNMALEDGEWDKADDFFEEVLNRNAECAEAYLGKFLIGEKCRNEDDVTKKHIETHKIPRTVILTAVDKDLERIKAIIEKFTIKWYLDESCLKIEYKEFERTYKSNTSFYEEALQTEKQSFANNKNLTRAKQFATGDLANKLNGIENKIFEFLENKINESKQHDAEMVKKIKAEYIASLDEWEKKCDQLYKDAEARKETDYQRACEIMETKDYDNAIRSFKLLYDYKDSKEKIIEIQKQIKMEKEEEAYQKACKRKNEAKTIEEYEAASKILYELGDYKDSKAQSEECWNIARKMEKAHRQKKKKIRIIVSSIVAVIVIFIIILNSVIIPNNKYNKAKKLWEAGDHTNAVKIFTELGNYQDSRERCVEYISIFPQTVSAGDRHTVGLKSDGTVVAVGSNGSGQCKVKDWKDIIAISAGDFHTVGLKSDGTVVAVGSNAFGQCNVKDWKHIMVISAGDEHTIGLKFDGTVVAIGGNSRGQCNVSGWRDIVAVSAGTYHTAGLKSDGTVVAVGSNAFGQCNVKDWKDIIAISTGDRHTVGLKSDGTVVAVGSNGYGQCDVSGWTDIVAVSAGDGHTVGLKSDGTVVAVGSNGYGQCYVSDWTDIVAISAGTYHTVGLKSDGTVVAVGSDYYGKCDVSGWTDIKLPSKSLK